MFLIKYGFHCFREPPNLSAGMEIREETAVEMANELRWWMEEGIRWKFRVGAEGDWFVFTGNVAALWLVSKLATFCDLLTFLYIGKPFKPKPLQVIYNYGKNGKFLR